jgi:glycine cleavage system H protein
MINTLLRTTPFINNLILRNKTYLPTYEWLTNGNIQKIGLSKDGHEQLGELVYIEFNVKKNQKFNESDELVVIESIKAVDSISAPYDCNIVDINSELIDNLENINNDPECEDQSWILKIEKL